MTYFMLGFGVACFVAAFLVHRVADKLEDAHAEERKRLLRLARRPYTSVDGFELRDRRTCDEDDIRLGER